MKKFVTIGLVQTRVSEDLDANLRNAVKLVELTAQKGAKIICLPELYRTIYFPQYKKFVKVNQLAERARGESARVFGAIARKHQVVIIVPIFEKAQNGYYNSVIVLDQKGKLPGIYRKIHIPQDPHFYEKNYFRPGDRGFQIFQTKFAKFAVLICYDQWFPEAARSATLAGAELIFYPTAIGYVVNARSAEGDWHDAWETVMRGHAIANSVYVAAVNRVGREGKLDFWGQSFVCDNFGQVRKSASATREESLVVSVDLATNKTIRDSWGFFKNRRPESYHLK